MRVVMCNEVGPPEALTMVELDSVPLREGQVRVAVAAVGLNFVDALFVQGLYQIKPAVPFVPGSELAGTISEVGSTVDGWAVGDRVMANVGLGGYCDEIVLSPGQLSRVPDSLDLPTAAALAQSYCTAWFTLHQRVGLRPGQWLLVLGAGGGVGLASLDVGRAMGAKVIAAASSNDKLAACMALGVDATINYTTESLKDRAREISGGGVDVVIDPVGGELSGQALRALGFNGQLAVVGFASGTIASLPANQILLRNRRVTGVDWGAWALGDPAGNAQVQVAVLNEIEAGNLHPTRPATYPLTEAGRALRDLLERRLVGKAVLIP